MGLGAVASRFLPAAAKAAPLVGRALTSGAIGGGETAAKGGGPWDIAQSVIVNAGLSAGGEKVLGAVGSNLPVRELTKAAEERVGKAAWLSIPSLGKAPLSAAEAMEKFAAATGAEKTILRAEIAAELDRVQLTAGVKAPMAGALFKKLSADPTYFVHRVAAKFADAIKANPLVLGALETPADGTVPFGAIAVGALGEKGGGLVRHIGMGR